MSHGTSISEDLANKIDGLVLAYLQRRKYTKSVESLCDESPTLSKLRDFPAFSGTSSQPLTTTLYDKTLEEIVYQFSNHSHFVNPLFFELGRQMNDLSKNFSNTLLDHCHAIPPNGTQPAVHSNTHRFYGHHSSSRARIRSTATQHATRTTERQDRIPAYDSRMGQFYPGPHILTADGGQPSFGNVPADQPMTTQVQQGVTPRRTPRGINFKENPQDFNPAEDQTTVTPPAEESSSAADQHEVVNAGKGNKDIIRSAPAPASTETAMDTSDVHPIEKEAREQETQAKRVEGAEQGTGNNLDLSLFNSSNHGDEGMNSMLSDEGASRRKKTPHRFGSAARRVVSAVDALVECANAEAHPEQQTAQMQSSNSHLSLLSNLEDVLDIWDYHNLPSNLEEMVGRYDQALHDFPAPNENAMDLHDDTNEHGREHDSIQVSTPLPVTEASSTCSANLGRNEDDTTTAEYMQNENVSGEDGCVVRTPLATASGLSCTSLDMDTREQTDKTKGFDETATNTAAPTTRSSLSSSSAGQGENGEENIVGKPSPLQPIASLSANSLPAGEVPPVLSDTRIADDGQTERTEAEEVPSGETQEAVPVSVLPPDEPMQPEGELSRESGEVSDQETETEKRKGREKQVPKDPSPTAAVTSEPPSNQPPVEKSNEGIVFDEVSPEKDPEMDGTETEKRRKGEPDREPSPHFTEMQPTRPSSTVSATGSEKSLRSRRQGKSIGDREGLRDAVLFDGSARSRGGMRNARDVEDPRNQKEKAKRESTTMSDLFDDDSSDHRPSSRDSVGSKREKKEKEQRRREREMEAERRRDREMHNKQREREKDKRGRRSSPVRGRERRDETTRGGGGRAGQRPDDRNERGRSREEKEGSRRRSVDEDSERGVRREPRRSEESEHVKRKREERRKREEAVEKKRLEDNRRREEAMREKKRREERERLMEEERRQDEIAEYERREKERRRQQEEQRRRVEEEREAAAEKERLEREMMGIEEDEALDRECEEAERRRRQAEEAAAKKAAEQQTVEKEGEMPEKERKGSRDESTTETVLEKKRVPDEEGGRRGETSLERKRVPDDEIPPDSKKKEQKKRVKSLEARLVESQRKKKQKAAEGHESNEEEKNTPKAHRRRSPSPSASLPFLTKKLAPTTKIPKRSSGSSSNGGDSQREPLPVVATEVEVETSFTESEVDLYRPERTGSAGLTGETSHSVFPLPSKARSRHVSSENPSKAPEMVGTAKPDYADRNLLITSSIRGAALGCKFERARENLKTSNTSAASSSRQVAPSTRSIVDTTDVIRSEKRPVTPQSMLSGNGLKMKIQLPTTLQDTSAVLRGHGTAKRHRASSPDRSSFSGLPKKNLKMDPSEMLSILNKVRPKEKR